MNWRESFMVEGECNCDDCCGQRALASIAKKVSAEEFACIMDVLDNYDLAIAAVEEMGQTIFEKEISRN